MCIRDSMYSACSLPLTQWQGIFFIHLCTEERDIFIQHAVFPWHNGRGYFFFTFAQRKGIYLCSMHWNRELRLLKGFSYLDKPGLLSPRVLTSDPGYHLMVLFCFPDLLLQFSLLSSSDYPLKTQK